MKLLITGGKSATAFKLLRNFSAEELILADYGDVPQIPFSNCRFFSLGELNKDTTAHVLLTFCLDQGVDTVLPVYDFEKDALLAARQLFMEFNIRLMIHDY
ncbi:hypothetical protein [Pedobacter sp. JY14-1]|uniref:hypothetical protein n=1 Tax=Pedobacter sp. JY14-1 TaxID=3034151 RepID=UPI0023E1962D|nr:hypothetical protein [Pedobacter sp. JY14-1]